MTVGSVRFSLDSTTNYQTENVAPYTIRGDSSGNYTAWTPPLGTHTLTVTPYTQSGAGGSAGLALSVTFTVMEEMPTSTPTPSWTPTRTPSLTPSRTPLPEDTPTPSLTPSDTPDGETTPEITPSDTPEPEPTASHTPVTPSLSPSWTPSFTPSFTPSWTPTWTPSLTPSWTPSLTPVQTPVVVYRINSGGPQVTTGGVTWSADANFSGGRVTTYTAAIAGTTDDVLYHTARVSDTDTTSFVYNLPATPGNYTVTLHFAETWFVGVSGRGSSASNQRVFDVLIENTLVLDNLDLNVVTRPLTAYVRSFTLNVTDGTLNINFPAAMRNRPIIEAIQVVRNSTSADMGIMAAPPPLTSPNMDEWAEVTAEAVPTAELLPPVVPVEPTATLIVPPTAYAGEDQTVVDLDGDGVEAVTLNGLLSYDMDGIVAYASWQLNGVEIASGLNPTVNLPVGVHTLTLIVFDTDGYAAGDTVTITISPAGS